MKFSDIAIIISQKKYSENSAIVKVFSQNHGVYRGFVSAPKSKKNQAIFQVGNLISFEWRSRNEEGLGSFYYCDLVKSFAANIIFDKLKLNCCSSLFSIIDNCFLEREVSQELFDEIYSFLTNIAQSKDEKKLFIANYVKLELSILKALGYGIDFSCCAVSNVVDNLAFVSPKSGRAVCFEVGKKYENLLLKLPPFLVASNDNIQDLHLQQGLKLSGYFLEKFILAEKNINLQSRTNIEAELVLN